jgi:hypothetical protein
VPQFQPEIQDEGTRNDKNVRYSFLTLNTEAVSCQPEASRKLEASKVDGDHHKKCLSGTREKTLKNIRLWAEDPRPEMWMFCLLDDPGSGKSTVAKHMAEEWKRNDKMLIARYFFSRDTVQTASISSFCSTVSNAFALCDTRFKAEKERWEARNKGWKIMQFEEQFDGLVAGPLKALNRRAILLIDALDECDGNGGGRTKLLAKLYDAGHTTSLRIFATGRPNDDITDWAKDAGVGCKGFKELGGGDEDVKKYIRFRFKDQPNVEDRIARAIRHAKGNFIKARVVCDILMRIGQEDSLSAGEEVNLDDLYALALEQSMPQDRAVQVAVEVVLQMILAARKPLSITELEELSPWGGGSRVEQIVNGLGSLLLFQDRNDPIRFLHPTFRQFLIERPTTITGFNESKLGHYTLASGCLNILQGGRESGSDRFGQRKGFVI